MAKPDDTLDAESAAALLGVKVETLYSYVSRGLLRSVGPSRTHGHTYRKEDLERLQQRKRARSGHGATAGSALRWGEPVIDSAVSTINARGPIYRGSSAVDLVRAGRGFEEIAELLWTGTLPVERPLWRAREDMLGWVLATRTKRTVAREVELRRLFAGLAAIAGEVPNRATLTADPVLELAQARSIIACLAATCGARVGRSDGGTIASVLAESLGVRARRSVIRALDIALGLLADHELNASTFTARIAASAGASLPAFMLAALGTLAGSKHGGASGDVERLIDEVVAADDVAAVVGRMLKSGAAIPGFHHMLYPDGDPRVEPLFEAARAANPRSRSLRVANELIKHVGRVRGERANVDLGLVVLADSLSIPRGGATLIFAIGRTAGWVAHGIEQRAQGFLLRPRARYIGPV